MFTYLTTFTDWYRNTNQVSLSVISYGENHHLTPKDFNDAKGSKEIWSDSIFLDAVLYKEYLCSSKSGFYIYLSRPDFDIKTFEIKILYKPEQHNEVVLFLRQLKKIKK